jgi:hypothetical protein
MSLTFKRSYLSTRKRSKRSEQSAAKVFGGRVQPNSGALPKASLKGDVKSNLFLVDDKFTDKMSYSLKVETWRKISDEAWRAHRRPAMRINFNDGDALIVLDEQSFMELKEKAGI